MTATTATRKPRKPKAPPVEPIPLLARDLADFLADALLFASEDSLLPSISTVRIDVDKGRLRAVSTDRYALGVRTMAYTGAAFPALLLATADVRDLVTLLRSRPVTRGVRGPEVSLHVEPEADSKTSTVTVEVANVIATYTSVDFTFPKWEPLVKKMQGATPSADAGTVALSPTLLTRFARLSATKGRGSRPLVIKTTGPHNGVQITVGSSDDFLGFLMPVRLSEQPNEVAA